jgi:tRNA-dihydrouridine synthase
MQNPWIFRQIEDAAAGREIYQPGLQEKQAVLLEYFELLREDMPELPAIGRMKQLAGQFTKGLVGGAQFRTTLYHSHSAQEILDNIGIYFQTLTEGKIFGDGLVETEAPSIDSCEIESCETALAA